MRIIDLSGKTALVTGATRGIGRSIADEFLAAGADLILTGTTKVGGERIYREMQRVKDSQTIEYLPVDFRSKESLYTFLRSLQDKNRIDICVNNAGTNHIKEIKDVSLEDIQTLHAVNLHAPFLILSNILPKMKKNGWGRVVNIGSLWSFLSRQGRSLYSTSKHALKGLTVTAALEYAPFNIMVNMVSPGFVWTDLSKETLSEKDIVDIESKIPAGRFAQPEDIAQTVLFLCSDMNSYITGQNIIVDGGYILE